MSCKYRLRGHKIYLDEDRTWRYADTDDPTAISPERPCGLCGHSRTEEGHDPCFGTLRGVRNACCGHGEDEMAYLQFPNRRTLRGKEALQEINQLKK